MDNLQILSRIVSVFSKTVKNRLMSTGLNVTLQHLWPSSDIPKVRYTLVTLVSASKRSIRRFIITEKAPTRAFSWLKAATTAFTFKTLLRHYAKQALTGMGGYKTLC